MGAKHGGAWGQDLYTGAGHDADENYAKTETRYAEVPFDIGGSARRGARVGDFTLGSLMKMWTREDLDLHGQRRECW